MRDELAKMIFFADNQNIPNADLEDDWAKRNLQHWKVEFEYVYNIADALLEAGWRPTTTDTLED